jgi:hypothetical protein
MVAVGFTTSGKTRGCGGLSREERTSALMGRRWGMRREDKRRDAWRPVRMQ